MPKPLRCGDREIGSLLKVVKSPAFPIQIEL
jgi:hypothetical protein